MQGPATPQARPSCTGWPAQAPFRQASLLVQPFWSSQALPSDAGTWGGGVPWAGGVLTPAPAWAASPAVQACPSEQGLPSVAAWPVQPPVWHVSPVVHALPSSQGVASSTAVCWQPVRGLQESAVQAF